MVLSARMVVKVMKVKVKVRLQGEKNEIEKVREILLKRCPELCLGAAREGSNPKYAGRQKWASYGDFIVNAIRRRRS